MRPWSARFGQEVRLILKADRRWAAPISADGMLPVSLNTSSLKCGRWCNGVIERDLATARRYLKEHLVFIGLFETYRSADQYLAALKGLLSITDRPEAAHEYVEAARLDVCDDGIIFSAAL